MYLVYGKARDTLGAIYMSFNDSRTIDLRAKGVFKPKRQVVYIIVIHRAAKTVAFVSSSILGHL